MKRVRVSKWIVTRGYGAITLYPFIFVRSEWRAKNAVVINHESIHLRQQAELLVLPFYLWYFVDFLVKFCKYGSWKKAYIIFEREAYANERNFEYLNERKRFAFMK